MNILLTGGAGFIGSNIADAYIRKGHNVFIIDNLKTGSEKFINKKSVFYKTDILDSDLDKIIKKNKIDIINHHAAHIDLRYSIKDPLFDMESNIKTTLILLESAARNKIRKFIFASSGGAVYGEQASYPSNEFTIPNPISPYGISKYASENYIRFYGKHYGIKFSILRYSNAYGPRQGTKGEAGVIGLFIKQMSENIQPTINGSGDNTRDFIYVDDISDLNLRILDTDESILLNVSSGIETSVNKVFDIINSEFGYKFDEKHGPEVKGEQEKSALESSLASIKLGWKCKTDLLKGIRETISQYTKS